jgi:hypothetical protein
MKLYEFLQKIEDSKSFDDLNISLYSRRRIPTELILGVYIKNFSLTRRYKSGAGYIDRSMLIRDLPKDFTEEWKEIEIFIKKSLAKVAIDEE